MKVHIGAGGLDQLIIAPSFPNISRTSRETVAVTCCRRIMLHACRFIASEQAFRFVRTLADEELGQSQLLLRISELELDCCTSTPP
jgi:hypothetical protein